MSGFLRRLAAQAIGSAEPVRSSSRLPYAAAPEAVQEIRLPEHTAAPASEPELPPPAQAPLVRAAPAPPTERLADSPRLLIDEVSTVPMRQANDIRLPELPVDDPAAVPRTRAHPIAPPASLTALTRSSRDSPRIEHAESQPTPRPQALRSDLAVTEPLHRARTVTALLPPQPLRHADSPLTTERQPVAGAALSAVEETTEVHVNIGRIEITAVHEAPPPKREPSRAGKPMTLEDYLARRGGGRS